MNAIEKLVTTTLGIEVDLLLSHLPEHELPADALLEEIVDSEHRLVALSADAGKRLYVASGDRKRVTRFDRPTPAHRRYVVFENGVERARIVSEGADVLTARPIEP
jgi:hypothetical protein